MRRDYEVGDWDATWYCTCCSAQLLYGYQLPLSEAVIDEVRKRLKIVTPQVIAKTTEGKRRYGGKGRQVVGEADPIERPRH